MIVPKWRSADFWPRLVTENGSFNKLIRAHGEFFKSRGFFLSGNSKSSVFTDEFVSNVLVLRISGED